MTADEMVKMLNNVDLTDPAQASSAIDVVNGIVGGIEATTQFANKYDTTTTAATTTKMSNKITSTTTKTLTTTTTTTSPTTTMDAMSTKKEAEKIRNLLKVGLSLTDTSGLASKLSPRDFEIRFVRSFEIERILE